MTDNQYGWLQTILSIVMMLLAVGLLFSDELGIADTKSLWIPISFLLFARVLLYQREISDLKRIIQHG